jgi:hypothetical protein
MSCKGLKNSALRKCMKKYAQESKRRFPTFNQAQDTVITTKGTNRSAVKAHQSMKLKAYGQGSGTSNNSLYSDGSYTARNKVKKK